MNPISNGRVCFSQLKMTKTNNRSCLGEDQLDRLLHIRIQCPALENWNGRNAVQLWWSDKTRRMNRNARASSKPLSTPSSDSVTNQDFSWDFSGCK